MAPKKQENNFLVSTLGKLLVFLVNYVYYATLFMKSVYSAVRTGTLNKAVCSSSLNGFYTRKCLQRGTNWDFK
jgi:hypothetical protein